jgi:hypothetical protein
MQKPAGTTLIVAVFRLLLAIAFCAALVIEVEGVPKPPPPSPTGPGGSATAKQAQQTGGSCAPGSSSAEEGETSGGRGNVSPTTDAEKKDDALKKKDKIKVTAIIREYNKLAALGLDNKLAALGLIHFLFRVR